MADRDIQIPFGPDLTNGAGIEPIAPESNEAPVEARDAFAEPTPEAVAALERDDPFPTPVVDVATSAPASTTASMPAVEPIAMAQEGARESAEEYRAGGLSEEEATAQGMDPMQMSILALKDSIGQGRELKAREKEREELAEALAADHEELADRENILANYHALAAEQDDIIATSTAQREAKKAELAQIAAELSETEAALERMRAYHSEQLQPLETDLGRVRASAEQAKNDERSRKSELNAAEKELNRADDSDANTMAIARHQQSRAAYEDARRRSEAAKDQLANVQRAYDDAKAQADGAEEPLERKVEDLNARSSALKESMNRLSDDISAARKRRQYCDNVFQYPDETAKMRREVETAEIAARQMDAENATLREQYEQSKKKARAAKAAIATVIVIIIVFIVTFIIVSNR